MPHSLDDLEVHRLIAYDETYHPPFTNINWLLDAGLDDRFQRKPVIRVNNLYAMYRAAANAMGIASLPDYMVSLTRGLIPVLP